MSVRPKHCRASIANSISFTPMSARATVRWNSPSGAQRWDTPLPARTGHFGLRVRRLCAKPSDSRFAFARLAWSITGAHAAGRIFVTPSALTISSAVDGRDERRRQPQQFRRGAGGFLVGCVAPHPRARTTSRNGRTRQQSGANINPAFHQKPIERRGKMHTEGTAAPDSSAVRVA
jgi:hypothetical protein